MRELAELAAVTHFMKLVMSTLGIEHRWTFRHRGGQLEGCSTPAPETCYTVTRRGHVTLLHVGDMLHSVREHVIDIETINY